MNAPTPVPAPIMIYMVGVNRFSVHQGERFADCLTWDEAVAAVSALIIHQAGITRAPFMRSADELLSWRERLRAMSQRVAAGGAA